MDIKIEVGDRVTYRRNDDGITRNACITTQANNLLLNPDEYEILKIERPKWEVVEEKKDLLTEEEREFLEFFTKHYKVGKIRFCEKYIDIISTINTCVTCPDYPENMKFEGVERWKNYTLKELGLEE